MTRRRRTLIALAGATVLFVVGVAPDLPVQVIAAPVSAIGWIFAPGIGRIWDATTLNKHEG